MKIKLDYSFTMKNFLPDGLEEDDFRNDVERISSAYRFVMSGRGKGWQKWCELPYRDAESIRQIKNYCDGVRKRAKNIVVFGIGGSALGISAVFSALCDRYSFRINDELPRLYVEDNIDPSRLSELLSAIDIKETHFVIISKSGNTIETLSQFFAVYDLVERFVGDKTKTYFTVITSLQSSLLFDFAKKEDLTVFPIGDGVGGRFSVFDNVGLIPLSMSGIDIEKLLFGAQNASVNAENNDIKNNIPLMTAYLKIKALSAGKTVNVIMPYSDKLSKCAEFYCQLWAESLGKAEDLDGNMVHVGQTPVKAIGTTDQHSQLQLYVDGPADKIFTFLGVEDYGCDFVVPNKGKFGGFTFSELINAERKATARALKEKNRPSYTLLLHRVDEIAVGELLTVMMYETAFAAAFLNVNAYDQPGVESGKKTALALLNKSSEKPDEEGKISRFTVNF